MRIFWLSHPFGAYRKTSPVTRSREDGAIAATFEDRDRLLRHGNADHGAQAPQGRARACLLV